VRERERARERERGRGGDKEERGRKKETCSSLKKVKGERYICSSFYILVCVCFS